MPDCTLFSMSLSLRKKKGESISLTTHLLPTTDDGSMTMKPQAIMDVHWIKMGSKFVEKFN